jgi:hypothetical protein
MSDAKKTAASAAKRKCPACGHELGQHKAVAGTDLLCGCAALKCGCDYMINIHTAK